MGSIDVHMDLDEEGPPAAAGSPTATSPAKAQPDGCVHDSVEERALRELNQATPGHSGSTLGSAKTLADTESENLTNLAVGGADEVAAKKRKLSTGPASPVKASSQPDAPQQPSSKPQTQDSTMAKKLDPETKRLREEEKERKAKEREDKAREREEKAKQREIEKAARDEAKRVKDAERAKEKAKRDEEKAKKEQAKAEEEEKKARKERAQMRIGAFFIKKPSNNVSAASSRQASVEPNSPAGTPKKGQLDAGPQLSDFEKTFPPFFLRPHTTLASSRALRPTEAEVAEAWSRIKAGQKGEEAAEDGQFVLLRTFKKPSTRRPVARSHRTTKQLVALANSTPTDFTNPTSSNPISALHELRALPLKFLKYHEDVRPPYIGTFTKQPSISVKKLCRRPHARAFATMDYEYDSEAEWEEPEEGEELGSDNEADADADEAEADPDEMADFIDDTEVAPPPAPSPPQEGGDDLVPKYTQLFWAEDHDTTIIPYGDGTIDMERFRAVCLLPGVTEPIDPWSTKYWDDAPEETGKGKKPAEGSAAATAHEAAAATSGAVTTDAVVCPSLAGTKRKKGPFKVPAKPLPAELIPEFKDFVFSQSISKLGMIELLKEKFPQVTKATLEQTLPQVAKREGKKWVAV